MKWGAEVENQQGDSPLIAEPDVGLDLTTLRSNDWSPNQEVYWIPSLSVWKQELKSSSSTMSIINIKANVTTVDFWELRSYYILVLTVKQDNVAKKMFPIYVCRMNEWPWSLTLLKFLLFLISPHSVPFNLWYLPL